MRRSPRDIRLDRGETLEDVAYTVGISPSHLSRIETGKVNCSDAVKRILARHYNLSPQDIAWPGLEPRDGAAPT